MENTTDDDCGASSPDRTHQPGQAEQIAEQPPTMDILGGRVYVVLFTFI